MEAGAGIHAAYLTHVGPSPGTLDDDYRADGDGWAGCQLAFLIRAVHMRDVSSTDAPAKSRLRLLAVGKLWGLVGAACS